MPIDMSKVLLTFIEETLEMLQSMEKALLDIEINNPDPEQINLMFRVMHTAKSGCAIFGFTTLVDFCHNLENLMQKIRVGSHKLTQEDINLLFSSVDLLRNAIDSFSRYREKVPDRACPREGVGADEGRLNLNLNRSYSNPDSHFRTTAFF